MGTSSSKTSNLCLSLLLFLKWLFKLHIISDWKISYDFQSNKLSELKHLKISMIPTHMAMNFSFWDFRFDILHQTFWNQETSVLFLSNKKVKLKLLIWIKLLPHLLSRIDWIPQSVFISLVSVWNRFESKNFESTLSS